MRKSNILQILAIVLFVLGGYTIFLNLQKEEMNASILAGIGPIIMGIALLIISKSGAITKKNDQD
jgi:hypothetical protein